MKIHQKKVSPKHNDSFFYDGLIAETKDYELVATGEIKIRSTDNNFICNGFKSYDEETEWENNFYNWNDDDLKKIDGDKYYWDFNNWFEVIKKEDSFEGVVYSEYDEAIEGLKTIQLESEVGR